MRTDRARVQKKWIVHLVALGDQCAIRVGGVTMQKSLVDRVVDHLDALIGNGQQLFNFVLGKLRDGHHPRRPAQHAPR